MTKKTDYFYDLAIGNSIRIAKGEA